MPISRISVPGVIEFPGYVLAPTGAKVFYVHASGVQSEDTAPIADRIHTTVNAALAECRSGRGDIVLCLPGHTENVAAADAWSNLGTKTGVKVLGLGEGDNRPTFTWTVATSTVLFDAASFGIENCILKLEPGTGTVTVAAPITVSAAGCYIRKCRIYAGTDGSNLCTIPITTTAGGDQFTFEDNYSTAAVAAASTCYMRVVGADRLLVRNNTIIHPSTDSATVGTISFLTTASTLVNISNNYIHNNASPSRVCISSGSTACTGFISDNRLRNVTDGSNIHIVSTTATWQLFENYGVNNDIETGILLGTPSV